MNISNTWLLLDELMLDHGSNPLATHTVNAMYTTFCPHVLSEVPSQYKLTPLKPQKPHDKTPGAVI